MHPASWIRAAAASSRTTFLTTQDSPGWADARPQLVLGSQYNVRWHGLGLVALSGPRGNVCLHLAPSDVWRLGCTREDFLVRNVDGLSGTHGCLCELFVIYTEYSVCGLSCIYRMKARVYSLYVKNNYSSHRYWLRRIKSKGEIFVGTTRITVELDDSESRDLLACI